MSAPRVFPVGHYVGQRHPEGVHLVRVGLAHLTLDADEFGVWVLAHGAGDSRGWTTADMVVLAERAELPDVPATIERLAAAGALVVVPRNSASEVAFAESHRLAPMLVGLGNSDEAPDTYAVGILGLPPVAMLDVGSFELWQWGHVAPSLWHMCEIRAKVAAGLGDPGGEREVLSELLGDLRPLLANSCAYLDLVRQG